MIFKSQIDIFFFFQIYQKGHYILLYYGFYNNILYVLNYLIMINWLNNNIFYQHHYSLIKYSIIIISLLIITYNKIFI